MSRLRGLLVVLFFASLDVSAFSANVPPARIMPLGDSITLGYSVPTYLSGYRDTLYSSLTNNGYNVDYAGTQLDTQNPALPDPNHEGHGGYRIDNIDAGIDSWLSLVNDPDVVLLLIGTNDFSQGYDTGNALNRLESLVAHIATARPYSKIIVANLPLRTDSSSLEAAQKIYNNAIPGMVSRQVSLGHDVYFVDIHSSLSAADLSSDGVHPNSSGYAKIAAAWLPAITKVITPLGTSDPPRLSHTTSPDSNHVVVTFSKPVEDAAANPALFSLSGGVSVLQATLDSGSKRIVTLTTGPLTSDLTYTLSVSGVHDRTPQQNGIPPGSTIAFTTERSVNGSFETGDYTGWTASGNLEIAVGNSYPTTDGADVLVFNSGQSTPNGVISQTIATTSGQAYVLLFDVGAVAYNNTSEQRLSLTVQGSGTLVSDTVSVFGLASGAPAWVAKSYRFVANSATTTLTFRDVSPTSFNLDMMLDHVRMTAAITRTLTVMSTPISGVNIGVTPTDKNGAGNGTTTFIRSYSEGTVVGFTAPATAGGYTFQEWQEDGVDLASSLSISVTVNGDHMFNAIYMPPGLVTNGSFETGDYTGWTQSGNTTIAVGHSYPTTDGADAVVFNGGQSVPNGVVSQTISTTPGQAYALSFDQGVFSYQSIAEQRMEVTVQGTGNPLVFQTLSIFGQGTGGWYTSRSLAFVANSPTTTITFRDVSQVTTNIDMLLDNVRVTVQNAPLITSQPQSQNVSTGGSATFSVTAAGQPPLSYQWRFNGTPIAGANASSFTINSAQPTDSGNYDVIVSNTSGSVTSTTAVLTVIPPGGLFNGSFESDYAGWSATGNQAVVSGGTYPATDGTKCVVFNGGQSTPNAILTQSFSTLAGQAYVLSFDQGVFAYQSTTEQRLEVTIQGMGDPLVFQTLSVFAQGTGGWYTSRTFAFVANNSTTTLMFRDVSQTTTNVDELLDNVRVTIQNAPIITAQPQSQTVPTGSSVTFSVSASGQAPLSYQWRFNGSPISGANASSYTIGSAQSPNNGNYDVIVSNSSGSVTSAIATLTVIPPGGLFNGSFESDYAGWTASGNQGIVSGPPYSVTDGTKAVAFNGGQSTPNGVLSQTFSTTIGQSYLLAFDQGAFSQANQSQQKMQVTVQGNGTLLSQTISVLAPGNGTRYQAQSFAFVANSTTTTLTFQDTSTTTTNVDELLDNVRVTIQP